MPPKKTTTTTTETPVATTSTGGAGAGAAAIDVPTHVEAPQEAVKEKKERKPRAPTEYNKFLGEKITELRISEPGKKSTEYMQMAIALWREKKAEA